MTIIEKLEALRDGKADVLKHGLREIAGEALAFISEGKNKEAELLAALRGELDVSNLWPDEAPCASCGGYFGDHAGFDCPPPHKTKFHEATK